MCETFVLAASDGSISRLWFLLPLIVIVSLVYSASRYESPGRIFRRAGRLCLQITFFMAAVLGLLAWLSWGL
ncbi:MAG TPA: hypothetical protein VKU82_03035 [Planctomycetaceae bacterium]|nr:hypothetical protein [Planctomycetaceae bacterium]